MTDEQLVDAVAAAMTGWTMDECGEDDAEAWRATARAAIAKMRELGFERPAVRGRSLMPRRRVPHAGWGRSILDDEPRL